MYCQKCGTQFEGSFCPSCGNPAKETPPIVINNMSSNANMGGVAGSSPKSKIVAFLLCFFLGYLGIHRFYVGKIGSGVLYFFTGGVFVIGWIVDIFKILSGTFRDGAGLIINR